MATPFKYIKKQKDFRSFIGGYLYDLSHSYVTSWLISFGAGLIASLLAMDLLLQGDRSPTTSATRVTEETARSAQSS